jgi:hypothetical protein
MVRPQIRQRSRLDPDSVLLDPSATSRTQPGWAPPSEPRTAMRRPTALGARRSAGCTRFARPHLQVARLVVVRLITVPVEQGCAHHSSEQGSHGPEAPHAGTAVFHLHRKPHGLQDSWLARTQN